MHSPPAALSYPSLVRPNGQNARSCDLVSLGEPLLRLTPPSGEPLRRATTLAVHVVGSQLNVAVDLARLGRRTAFLSKVPDTPLGMLVLDACRSYGLDVSHVKLVAGGKMGVTWVEQSGDIAHVTAEQVEAVMGDKHDLRVKRQETPRGRAAWMHQRGAGPVGGAQTPGT